MTETEWSKLKLIKALCPDIDPEKLEEYFCSRCKYLYTNCYDVFTRMERLKIEEKMEFVLDEKNGMKRIVLIYKCFEGKKDE